MSTDDKLTRALYQREQAEKRERETAALSADAPRVRMDEFERLLNELLRADQRGMRSDERNADGHHLHGTEVRQQAQAEFVEARKAVTDYVREVWGTYLRQVEHTDVVRNGMQQIINKLDAEIQRTRAFETDALRVHGVTFLFVRDGCVLLEKCPKKRDVLGVGEWFVPGGKVEPNESLRDTVAREVREELGIEVIHAKPLPLIEGSRVQLFEGSEPSLFLMRPFVVTDYEGSIPQVTVDGGLPLRWVPIAEALESPVRQVAAMVAMAAGYVAQRERLIGKTPAAANEAP